MTKVSPTGGLVVCLAFFSERSLTEVSNGLVVDPEKMAMVAATLPVPDANTLDSLMSEIGETPVRKQGMAFETPQEEREKLAQAYQFIEGLN